MKYDTYEYLAMLCTLIIFFGGYGGWWFGNSGTSILYWILLFSISFKLWDWLSSRRSRYEGTEKVFSKNTPSINRVDDTEYNSVYEYTQSQTILDPSKSLPSFNSVISKEIRPPESFFSVPRKIDWDTLNKTRKHHGDLGEMFVYDLEKNYLTKVGRSDLAEGVHHVASEGDGHGYDIQSFNKDGSKKFIEVKATNSSTGFSFNISKNEFNFLQNNLSSAFVYHVHNVNNERETTVVVYPAGEVLNSPSISPSGYVVKM